MKPRLAPQFENLVSDNFKVLFEMLDPREFICIPISLNDLPPRYGPESRDDLRAPSLPLVCADVLLVVKFIKKPAPHSINLLVFGIGNLVLNEANYSSPLELREIVFVPNFVEFRPDLGLGVLPLWLGPFTRFSVRRLHILL